MDIRQIWKLGLYGQTGQILVTGIIPRRQITTIMRHATNTDTLKDTKTDRHKGRQIQRQTQRQTDTKTDRYKDRQTDTKADRHKGSQPKTNAGHADTHTQIQEHTDKYRRLYTDRHIQPLTTRRSYPE